MWVTKVFILFLFAVYPSYSERIYFSNGDILTGEIWRETQQNTIIVTEHGSYKVTSANILRIDYEGKKKFRVIKKSGEILTVYPLESNKEEISFLYSQKEKAPKKISWNEVFAVRIVKY